MPPSVLLCRWNWASLICLLWIVCVYNYSLEPQYLQQLRPGFHTAQHLCRVCTQPTATMQINVDRKRTVHPLIPAGSTGINAQYKQCLFFYSFDYMVSLKTCTKKENSHKCSFVGFFVLISSYPLTVDTLPILIFWSTVTCDILYFLFWIFNIKFISHCWGSTSVFLLLLWANTLMFTGIRGRQRKRSKPHKQMHANAHLYLLPSAVQQLVHPDFPKKQMMEEKQG